LCDFHSVCVRADGLLAHVSGNSHSEAVKAAGWAENKPHARPVFIEAEWNGVGEYPGADKICRVPNGEKLTAKQRQTVDRHYKALAEVMNSDNPSKIALAKFAAPEFSDVRQIFATKAKNLTEEMRWLAKEIGPQVDGFTDRFIATINRKADYAKVWPAFCVWLLMDEKHGMIQHTKKYPDAEKAIRGVAELYQRWADTGKKPTKEEFQSAAYAANAAANAAYAANAANAAYAAANAANAAANAANAAANAANAAANAAYAANAANAAYAAARKAQWSAMADKLIKLMEAA